MILKTREQKKKKKTEKGKNEDFSLTNVLKTKTWETEKKLKKNEKEHQKGESKKKNEKPFFKTQKNKTWKIKRKKRWPSKGNRQNRVFWEQKKTEKGSFAEVYKDTKICQESDRDRKQRYNQRTRTNFLKGGKKLENRENTERQQIEHVDRGWRKVEMKR